mmetsp:Transcript_18158/g.21800  ORF Transcript_18158/g.21800 Transcript_18158/m.21800 type:complete len:101 (-) Transcript_18158:161-463(-)
MLRGFFRKGQQVIATHHTPRLTRSVAALRGHQKSKNTISSNAYRSFHSSRPAFHKTVPIVYVDPTEEEIEVQAEVGKNLLDIAHDNNIELEGACFRSSNG